MLTCSPLPMKEPTAQMNLVTPRNGPGEVWLCALAWYTVGTQYLQSKDGALANSWECNRPLPGTRGHGFFI